MTAGATEAYIREVIDRIPRAMPGRARIEADLRLHIEELMAEAPGGDVRERMGPPGEVAAEFLAHLPLTPASHGRRFVAFVVDVAVIVLPFVPLFVMASAGGWDAAANPATPFIVVAAVVVGLVGILYFPVFEAVWGQTLGKWLVGICVVREDGSRAGWLAAVLRRLPFFMNFFPIDALFVFFTERRQRAFDRVAGTLVVGCRASGATRDFRPMALAALLVLAGCVPPDPVASPAPRGGESSPAGSRDRPAEMLPVAEHHAHIRSRAATDALHRAQAAVGHALAEGDTGALSAADLVRAMDGVGLERAAVLSVAYLFGMPEVDLPGAAGLVRAENDYVAAEVSRYPERLVGFCSVNPLAEYALGELDRCGGLDGMVGVKLHLASSGVDLRDAEQVRALAAFFARADALRLAIAVHLRTRNPAFGREDAETFIREVLERAPNATVQIAHMAGGGGSFDAPAMAALDAFVARLEESPAAYDDRLFFDLSAAVLPPEVLQKLVPEPLWDDPGLLRQVEESHRALADAIRRLGPHRVVFGTDWFGEDGLLPFSVYLAAVRTTLPLSEAEMRVVLGNVAPYLR
jgi:uncharacterized protein